MLLFLTSIIFINTCAGLNLVEILFKSKINDAKCFARCQSVETEQERTQCLSLCNILINNPEDEDICSLSSVCTGGCRVACDAAEDGDDLEKISLGGGSIEKCKLSWNLEKTGGDVVFLIAGRDQAGMWNLISNTVTETSMELSYTLAAKMVEIQIFAVGAHEVHDIISVEVAGNQCQEDVPQPQEWREEEEEEEINLDGLDVLEVIIEKDMETIIKENTSIAATVVLVLLSVFAVFFTVAIIIVRLRGQKTKEAQVGQIYEAVPELPYSPPVRTLHTSASPKVLTETLLQPRVISTINESDEYEDIQVSS